MTEVIAVKKCGLIGLVVCVTMTTLSADIGPPIDVGARARGAREIVVATVVEVESAFAVNEYGDQLIVSHGLLQVHETMKGAHAAALQIVVEGGTVGDLKLEVSDIPALEPGDRAVFFLDRTPSGTRQLHGRGLGLLKLDSNDRVLGNGLTLDEVRRSVRSAGQ
jgi:hypothetical protein